MSHLKKWTQKNQIIIFMFTFVIFQQEKSEKLQLKMKGSSKSSQQIQLEIKDLKDQISNGKLSNK